MKFSKKEIAASILLIFVLFGYFTWDRLNRRPWDETNNEERITLGIPIIEENFLRTSAAGMWYNPDTVLPRHSLKEVTVEMDRATLNVMILNFYTMEKKQDCSTTTITAKTALTCILTMTPGIGQKRFRAPR